MKHSIYFANNNEDIRSELESRGFFLCACCEFNNSKWLSYFYREENGKREFHGLGYACEHDCDGACAKKCIECAIIESIHDRNIHIFNDIDDMIKFLNKNNL